MAALIEQFSSSATLFTSRYTSSSKSTLSRINAPCFAMIGAPSVEGWRPSAIFSNQMPRLSVKLSGV